MKKNLFSLSILAIALTTGSCISDLNEGQTPGANDAGQAITLKAWANKQTRAGATQAADITDFAVLATDTTTGAADPVLIDGALVTGSGSNWTYSPPAFWPETASVNFFAFSPTTAPGVTGGATALVGQNDATPGQPTIEYELPATLSDQKDLLVARHSGTFAQDGARGVLLNFRHALSRVLFQAKSESAMDFEVLSIRLKNVKSKATLDLNNVPKDTDTFPYPTDNATVASPGYQTFWVPDGSSVVDLEANLTTDTVAGDGAWHYIVGDDDALYVIPQENDPSDMAKTEPLPGGPGSGTSTKFYIEITYQEVGAGAVPKTYAVPVPAIVGDAYISSIAFEMERQYTFRFELFGKKPIEFQGVTVSPYNEVTQEEPLRLTWAGSNIYYDAALKHLTFADSDDKSKEEYQGVFFKWGSLTGISPDGTYITGSTVTYPKGGEAVTAASPDWTAIPYDTGTQNLSITHGTDTVNGKGDICKYLTQMGWAPAGKRWRMPTNSEYAAAGDYANAGTWTTPSGNAYGTTPFTGGKKRQNLNTPYFPASGHRYSAGGALGNVGTYGFYWSSSPSSAAAGLYLLFTSTSVVPASNAAKTIGMSVRCVTE